MISSVPRAAATLALLVVGVVTALMQLAPEAEATPAPPPWTRSRYVSNPSTVYAWNAGCWEATARPKGNGTTGGRVILSFGDPAKRGTPAEYGIYLHPNTATFMSLDAVRGYGLAYGNGFAYCSPASAAIRVILGTSNDFYHRNLSNPNPVTGYEAFGTYWARMISEANETKITNKVTFDGGIDAEAGEGFAETYGATPARRFYDGYAAGKAEAGSLAGFIVDYGSADGCPWGVSYNNAWCDLDPPGGAAPDWHQYDYWYVAWHGAYGVAASIPEIYLEDGTNAEQWKNISRYGVHYQDGKMGFTATLTQHQACVDNGGASACPGTFNTPGQGWAQLYYELNEHLSTEASDLGFDSTDISWITCSTTNLTGSPPFNWCVPEP